MHPSSSRRRDRRRGREEFPLHASRVIERPPTPDLSPKPSIFPLPRDDPQQLTPFLSFPFDANPYDPNIRRQYLSSLLSSCSPQELLFISQTITPLLKRDFLSDLPPELALHILTFVDEPVALLRASLVSLRWYNLARDDGLWKRMCHVHGFDDWHEAQMEFQLALDRRRMRKGKEKEGDNRFFGKEEGVLERRHLGDIGSDPSSPPSEHHRHRHRESNAMNFSYRRHFKHSYMTRANWRKGGRLLNAHSMPIVSPDSGTVTSLALDSDFVVVGLANSRIKIFSAATGVLSRTLVGHDSGVWGVCLVSKGGYRIPAPIKTGQEPLQRDWEPTQSLQSPRSMQSPEPTQESRSGRTRGTRKHKKEAPISQDHEDISPSQTSTDVGIIKLFTKTSDGPPLQRSSELTEPPEQIQSSSSSGRKGKSKKPDQTSPHAPDGKDAPSSQVHSGAGRSRRSSHATSPNLLDRRPDRRRHETHVMPSESLERLVSPAMMLALGLELSDSSGSSDTDTGHSSEDEETTQAREAARQRRRLQHLHESQAQQHHEEEDVEELRGLGTHASTVKMTHTTPGWGQPNAIVVSGGCDKTVRVWDARSGQCIYVLHGHTSTIRSIRMLDNRPIAVTGSRDTTLRVWDVQLGRCLRVLEGHQRSVRCLDVSGNKVVSGSYDSTCRLWDIDTGECLHVLSGHFHEVYSVAFDGVRIASGGLDTSVRIWDAETGQCVALLQGHTALVCELQLSPSIDILATGGSDGRVITFSLSTFKPLHKIYAHESSVTSLQFDRNFLVTGGNDGRVRLFETASGKFVREMTHRSENVWKVGFVRDTCAIMCKKDGKTVVEIWSLRSRSRRKEKEKEKEKKAVVELG